MRDYVSRLLGERWQVTAVADGAAALAAARTAPPDLVVADVMMPELDGFELLAALKSDPSTRDVPVVLLSARAGEEATLKGINAGADDYLVKPFTARDLMARVDAQVQRGSGACGATRERTAARRGQPRQGRVPGDALARAAHAAQRDSRLGAHAADRHAAAGTARSRHAGDRAQRQGAGPARGRSARRLARDFRQAGDQGRGRQPARGHQRRRRRAASGADRQGAAIADGDRSRPPTS